MSLIRPLDRETGRLERAEGIVELALTKDDVAVRYGCATSDRIHRDEIASFLRDLIAPHKRGATAIEIEGFEGVSYGEVIEAADVVLRAGFTLVSIGLIQQYCRGRL